MPQDTINLWFPKYNFIIDELQVGSTVTREMNSWPLKFYSHFHLILDMVVIK